MFLACPLKKTLRVALTAYQSHLPFVRLHRGQASEAAYTFPRLAPAQVAAHHRFVWVRIIGNIFGLLYVYLGVRQVKIDFVKRCGLCDTDGRDVGAAL